MRAFLLSVLLALPCFAQGVTGTVTDSATRAPVRGAVVTLIDSSGRHMGIAAVGEDGRFRLAAPGAGSYRVRAQRIGYRPSERGPLQIGAEFRQVDISLRALGQLLDTVRVSRAANCMRDDGSNAFAVWQQAQAAVAAVAVAQRRAIYTRIIRELVVYDRAGLVQRRDAVVSSGFSRVAWQSPSLDSLVRQGFVVEDADGSITYHAPDLEALLSDDFARVFCLRLAASDDGQLLGISFAPSAEVKTSSIAGTFWVERRSSSPRRLEFRFTGIRPGQRNAGAGGWIEFVRARSDEWMIGRWSLTMPQVAEITTPASNRPSAPTRRESIVLAVHVTSGEVSLARVGADTLFLMPPASLHGFVRETNDRPVGGAVIALEGDQRATTTSDASGAFRFDSIYPGNYRVVARDTAGGAIFAAVTATMTAVDLSLDLRGSPNKPAPVVAAATPPVIASRSDGLVLVRGIVQDTVGRGIPYANVVVQSRPAMVADETGRFTLTLRPSEYRVVIRRIGHAPVTQQLRARRDTMVAIRLTPLAMELAQVDVLERSADMLSRMGFYDRVRDRQRGLNNGWFLTPEDIAARPVGRVTHLVTQFPGVRLRRNRAGSMTAVGLHDCVIAIFLNGAQLNLENEDGGLDALVPMNSVTAVELYTRGVNAPARYQLMNDPCGTIVLWTK